MTSENPNYENLEYKELLKHHAQIKDLNFYDILTQRENVEDFTLESEHLILDYNRNLVNNNTLPLLCKFLESKNFYGFRESLNSSGLLNITESKSADHIALRNTEHNVFTGNSDIIASIELSLEKIKNLTETIHSKTQTATLIGNIQHVVHVGIGGSDLGPRMVVDALKEFQSESSPELLFINSVDPVQITEVLNSVNLQNTVFILVSKSFKTPEVLIIAQNILSQLESRNINYKTRFLTISSNPEAAKLLATHNENALLIPETIGGRYSLWSSTGLSISIFIGYDRFRELLEGASSMDKHFLNQPVLRNMPVVLALLEYWYTNFFNSTFSTVNPYSERLALLPDYLQQLQMESNGKSTDMYGNAVSYPTAAAIIGGTGTQCQHSYYQALHQGNHFFYVELIGLLRTADHEVYKRNFDFLFSSMLAQAHTMIAGYKSSQKESVPQHKVIKGNKPSNMIFIKTWSPSALGSLLAMYEHKTVVLGLLWQINSFDQWGVERGKRICTEIEDYMSKKTSSTSFINSANALNIKMYQGKT